MKTFNLFSLLSFILASLINVGYAYDTPLFEVRIKVPSDISNEKSPEYQEFVDTVVEEIHDIIIKNKDLCDNPDDIDFIQEDYDLNIKNDSKRHEKYPIKYATLIPVLELDSFIMMYGHICPEFVDKVKALPYVTSVDIPIAIIEEPPRPFNIYYCEAEEYGYPCCPEEFNIVKFHNEIGDWGYDLDKGNWCGATVFPSKEKEKCFSEPLGYPCCSTCTETVFTDDDGKWGIEDGKWCGIINAKVKNEEEEKKCINKSIGYPCCSSSTDTIYTDDDGNWGIEKNKWCLIIYEC